MIRLGFASLLLVSVSAAGCGLYAHDKETPDAACYELACPAIPADPLRDPSTGLCASPNVSCPPPDENGCTTCCGTGEGYPEEPSCEGPCEGLAEAACLSTAGCHAQYNGLPPDDTIQQQPPVFAACWDIQPLAPVEGGGCGGLDPLTCATHDDCTTVLYTDAAGSPAFDYCNAEPAGSASPGTCSGQVLCNGVPPSCPTGSVAGIANDCWTGYCIPLSDCSDANPNPGSCTPTTGGASCALAPPACPSGTKPGYAANCPTGYCIPAGDCPQPTCAQLTTAAACEANPSCEAELAGSDCTCDESGNCTCAIETFSSCVSKN